MSRVRVTVIGGGMAGCAAATSAADAGAEVALWEAHSNLGGVAERAQHHLLCGFYELDRDRPIPVEGEATTPWIEALGRAPAQRRGRVWLLPTDHKHLAQALQSALARRAIHQCFQRRLTALQWTGAAWRLVDHHGLAAETDVVIDASGSAVAHALTGLPRRPASQWAAMRAVIEAELPESRAGRLTLQRRVTSMCQGAALVIDPLDPDRKHWQLCLDCAPDATVSAVRERLEALTDALGGTLLRSTDGIVARDSGGAAAQIDCDQLFGTTRRGLCWAAWPVEHHGPTGVRWRYPTGNRHGVPECCARIADAPGPLWVIGRAAPVDADAAAALRVTGTCLAMGLAVGSHAAD